MERLRYPANHIKQQPAEIWDDTLLDVWLNTIHDDSCQKRLDASRTQQRTDMKRPLLISCLILLSHQQLQADIISSVSVTGQVDIRDVLIAPTLLNEDALAYTDRIHEWNDIPSGIPQLIGAEYIKTGNDNRDDPNLLITVTLSQPATLYMFFDTRIEGDGVIADTPRPWMTDLGLVDTGFDIGLDSHGFGIVDTLFSVYEGTFSAGDVEFLAQARGGVGMYGIAASAATAVPEPSALVLFLLGGIVLTCRMHWLNRKSSISVSRCGLISR